MAMSVAEARSEIKSLFDQADIIERKYPDPEKMPAEDTEQLKKLLTDIDSLETKLGVLETAEQRKSRILEGMERYNKPANGAQRPGQQADEVDRESRKSPGEQFITNRDYRELKNDRRFTSRLAKVQFAVNLADGTSLILWSKQSAREQKT